MKHKLSGCVPVGVHFYQSNREVLNWLAAAKRPQLRRIMAKYQRIVRLLSVYVDEIMFVNVKCTCGHLGYIPASTWGYPKRFIFSLAFLPNLSKSTLHKRVAATLSIPKKHSKYEYTRT